MSRKKVLTLLRQGDFVSGEAISETLGLSRAAVWKAVDGLRKEGYEIQAKTGLGYCLGHCPDVLSEGEIRHYLPAGLHLGTSLIGLDTVDSTNTYLKNKATLGAPHGTVVVAEHQSAGRGRMARGFYSPPGTGIYMSVLLRPMCAPQDLMGLTAMVAVAVCDAFKRVCGLEAQIKWPNDVVVSRRKLCGILTELSLEGETGRIDHVVVGLGINVGQDAFPSELEDCAVSFKQLGYTVSRPQLAAAVITALDEVARKLSHPELYLSAYRQRCVNLGQELELVRLDGSKVSATGLAIDDSFALVVKHRDGRRETLQSGEVSVRGFYGKE